MADHPLGVWKLYGAQRVILGRDAEGFFAFSSVCTHEGTPLEFREPGPCTAPTSCTSTSMTGNTRCPLHFSRFDGNGTAISTPATVPLPHYRVTVTAGEITVHPATTVAAAVRSMSA